MNICIQSLTTVERFGAEKGYRMIKEAGFEGIDWNIERAWSPKEVAAAESLEGLCAFEGALEDALAHYAEELAAIRENGLIISQAHAPFPPYRAYREDILDYAIEIYKNVIRFCAAVGCPRIIIHGVSPLEKEPDMTRERLELLNMRLYESLIPTLQEVKTVTVCLENLFYSSLRLGPKQYWEGVCSDPYEAAAWIDRLNEKAGGTYFGLCLDSGHLSLLRKPPLSYIPILGKRIVALHLHDNTGDHDNHLIPYSGVIYWDELLGELKKVGYAGDISFETYRQYIAARTPDELVPATLRFNAEIGEYMRSVLN